MHFFLSIFALLFVIPARAEATGQVLRLDAKLVPVDASASPILNPQSKQITILPLENLKGGYRYSMIESNRVLGLLKVSFTPSPEDYRVGELDLRLPFLNSKPISASLYGFKSIDVGNGRIREIFATPIGKPGGVLRHDELFRLYQESALISRARMERIKKQGDFNYYDAKVFFKFLEVAVYLGRQSFLVMNSDVMDIRNFLKNQMQLDKEGARVILEGTRQKKNDVEQLLTFVDFVDADHLKFVWGVIKERAAGGFSDEACRNYISFSNTLSGGEFDSGLVDSWDQHKDYKLVTLAAEAIRVCAKASLDTKNASSDLKEHAQKLLEAANVLGGVASGKRAVDSITETQKMLTVR